MPLPPELADDYARLKEQMRRLQAQIAASNVVEVMASTATDETLTISAGTDSGFATLTSGPQLTIATNSGKIVVTVSGRVKLPAANANALGVISYEIRDAGGVQVVAPDLYRGPAAFVRAAAVGATAQGSYAYVHDGLEPGTYTIKTLYRFADGAGAGGPYTANFISRALIAKGY